MVLQYVKDIMASELCASHLRDSLSSTMYNSSGGSWWK